jgi:hypothetical protein
VYAREVDGQPLTLAVSGQVWRDSLVLVDQETESLWSHLLGEAKAGPLKGKQLQQLPSVLTDWRSWRRHHPESTVAWLSPPLDYRPPSRRDVFAEQPERFVLGVAAGGHSKAWGFDELSRTPVLNDHWDGQPVLVVFERFALTPRLYTRTLGGRILTFGMAGDQLRDQETGSTWEPATGRAVTGPLAGAELLLLPARVTYRHVWEKVHPRPDSARHDRGEP